ncbi:WD40 repeat-like protein [Auriscalpium vulgare]|uniref:WD40 repeat-like protein n=1 Tax=Auriscalpium vulgare TaxID=40419 RepID=A0ACB8RVW3_9AGAM|nr:WD40 repeat-like protein [Auriscalpium vulgare]
MDIDSEDEPWYRKPGVTPPFRLLRTLSANDQKIPLTCLAIFPWNVDSINALWSFNWNDRQSEVAPEKEKWQESVEKLQGMIAVGSVGELHIVRATCAQPDVFIKLKLPRTHGTEPSSVSCVAWAVSASYEPLVVFGWGSLLILYDVGNRKQVGCLRGHGGQITSIAVHPIHPELICTTSRDFTARIYDLHYKPTPDALGNLCWLPGRGPSRAGAAHGLRAVEPEGKLDDVGRCVAVFVGGRSGGHQAAVLGAAFHPRMPLLATCGMDRTTKIWHIPTLQDYKLERVDKPLFTSPLLHTARVLSIAWLSDDVLISHSAPAFMRKQDEPNPIYKTWDEGGSIVVWRWLGLDRFFPANKPPGEAPLRGCASVRNPSPSFTVLSSLPLLRLMPSLRMSLYYTETHDPIILFPFSNSVRILNIVDIPAKVPPPHPPKNAEDEAADAVAGLKLDDEDEVEGANENGAEVEVQDWAADLGWQVIARASDETMQGVEVGLDGMLMVAIGNRGSIWVWLKDEP